MINIGGLKSTSSLSKVMPLDIQPNAVDLRLGKVFKIKDNVFTIDEDHKAHRGSVEYEVWKMVTIICILAHMKLL